MTTLQYTFLFFLGAAAGFTGLAIIMMFVSIGAGLATL